jgi:phage shock protein PspC (stress-responsive transcriptional regulator)
MSSRNNNPGWGVLAGALLIGLGLWLLLGGLFAPVAKVIAFLGSVGWPLLLVGLGILLILRARGGGFNVNGKKLYRSRSNKMIGGVIGGVAEYLGVDATVLRVIYAFLSLVSGVVWGPVLYILAMIIVPETPYPDGWVPAPAPPVPAPPAPQAPPAPPMPQSGFYAPEPPQAPTPPAQPPAYEAPATPPAAPVAPEPPEVPSDPMTPPEAPQVPPAPPVL